MGGNAKSVARVRTRTPAAHSPRMGRPVVFVTLVPSTPRWMDSACLVSKLFMFIGFESQDVRSHGHTDTTIFLPAMYCSNYFFQGKSRFNSFSPRQMLLQLYSSQVNTAPAIFYADKY